MEKLTQLLQKLINKETITYLVFGVLTTVVNLVVFKIFDIILGDKLLLLTNFIAWVAAVAFAYVTNKLLVFNSKSWSPSTLKAELPAFIGARMLTLGIEEAGLFVFITWLAFDKYGISLAFLTDGNATFDIRIGGTMLVKIAIAVVVVITNYVLSKLIIFRKKANN